LKHYPSLKNGPWREAIEKQGGLQLMSIDPPCDMGANCSMHIESNGDTFRLNAGCILTLCPKEEWSHSHEA
jgi:hypothetical protein